MPEFPVSRPITVAAKLPAGSLEIVAEERPTATVDVQPYDGSSESHELAEHTRVDLRGDTLTVAVPEGVGRMFRRSGGVRIQIRVPLDSAAQISSASADTTCHGRFARLDVDSASGDVHVEHVTGAANFRMASGDVRVVRVDGQLKVNGASGDFTAQQAGGPVEANLASGDIDIHDAAADVRAKTASGDVRIGSARQGTVRVGTASGDVGVGVRAGTGVWLDLNTMSGTTRNGLNMPPGGDAPNGHQLSIEVRTASGDIDVHRVG